MGLFGKVEGNPCFRLGSYNPVTLEFNAQMAGQRTHPAGELEIHPRGLGVARGMVVHEHDGLGAKGQAPGKEFSRLEVHVGADSSFDPLNLAPRAPAGLRPEPKPLPRLGPDGRIEVSNEVPRKAASGLHAAGLRGSLAIQAVLPRKLKRLEQGAALAASQGAKPRGKHIGSELIGLEKDFKLGTPREAGSEDFQGLFEVGECGKCVHSPAMIKVRA